MQILKVYKKSSSEFIVNVKDRDTYYNFFGPTASDAYASLIFDVLKKSICYYSSDIVEKELSLSLLNILVDISNKHIFRVKRELNRLLKYFGFN